jgi:nitrite reductase/ring-hydroxylating ferredoxin subunit
MLRLGRVAELGAGAMACTAAEGRTFTICKVEGNIYAVDGFCPHRGAPLAHGALHGHTIVCPWHAWEFDCRTGEGDCGKITTYPVLIEEDSIFINAGTP